MTGNSLGHKEMAAKDENLDLGLKV